MGLKPVGLGARDTLRLEGGMMLYGSEMRRPSPFEVVYGWLVDLSKEFVGREALEAEGKRFRQEAGRIRDGGPGDCPPRVQDL